MNSSQHNYVCQLCGYIFPNGTEREVWNRISHHMATEHPFWYPKNEYSRGNMARYLDYEDPREARSKW